MHKVLERAARGEDAWAVFEEVARRETAHLQFGLQTDADWERMRGQVERGLDTIESAEVVDVERSFELMLDDVLLRGQIDRIDRVGGGDLVRDYKTGRVGDADAVQLDAYLRAVPNPVGAVFDELARGGQRGFVLEDVPGDFPKPVQRLTPEQLRGRIETFERLVAAIAASVRAGRLAVHPADPDSCTRTQCDGYDLCRVARNRWFERIEREPPEDEA